MSPGRRYEKWNLAQIARPVRVFPILASPQPQPQPPQHVSSFTVELYPQPPPRHTPMASTQPRPAPLACLSCRNKHLKCDGRLPICARCADSKSECVFVRSRRGIRGRGRRQPDASSRVMQNGSTSRLPAALHQQRQLPSPASTEVQSRSAATTAPHFPSPSGSSSSSTAADEFIDVYYEYFHSAHPFVVPRAAINAGLVHLPPYLRTTMAYLASHYANPTHSPLPDACDLTMLTHVPENLYKVQALLLLALSSFARLESPKGTTALVQAIDTARRLRLDRESSVQSQPFALQESCRRTWWELFVVATVVRSMLNVNVQLDLTDCDLYLPGDCDDYNHNRPQTDLRTLQDMQNRFLSDIDLPWSAFAHKIEATMILRTVLETEQHAKGDALRYTYDACQASISSWWLSLPTDKGLDNAGRDVDTDECMFFALMVINMASLRINLPRSDLSPTWRDATLCSPIEIQASAREASYHTASALKAANTLSTLIASEGSSKLHTPCSACAIAFGTIVQLPAYLQEANDTKCSNLKQNIQLGLTYLKRMGEVWPMAFAVRTQLAQIASQVLATPRKRDSGFSQQVADQHKARIGSLPENNLNEHLYHAVAPPPPPISTPSIPSSDGSMKHEAPRGDRWLDFARDQLMGHDPSEVTKYDTVELEGEDSGWLRDLVNAPIDFENMHSFMETPSWAEVI